MWRMPTEVENCRNFDFLLSWVVLSKIEIYSNGNIQHILAWVTLSKQTHTFVAVAQPAAINNILLNNCSLFCYWAIEYSNPSPDTYLIDWHIQFDADTHTKYSIFTKSAVGCCCFWWCCWYVVGKSSRLIYAK